MSVNSYLQNLASDLVLSDDEKEHVAVSVSTIKGRLDNYFENDVTDKIVFGSYSRGTILPRSDDEDSDVDIMVVFDNPYSYKPQTFLNKLKGFAEHYYSTSEIYQSSPTIVLELNHIKFELTPAYMFYGLCYIPSGPSDWMTTDPDGFNSELIECNKNNGYKIKPIVRLLKHWNIWKNSRDMASFELETKKFFQSFDMNERDDIRDLYSCVKVLDKAKQTLFSVNIVFGIASLIDNKYVVMFATVAQILSAILIFVIECNFIDDPRLSLIGVQAILSSQVFLDTIMFFLYKTKMDELYAEGYRMMISPGISENGRDAALLSYAVEYEAVKAHYKIHLSERIFMKNRNNLEEKWKQILSQRNIPG